MLHKSTVHITRSKPKKDTAYYTRVKRFMNINPVIYVFRVWVA